MSTKAFSCGGTSLTPEQCPLEHLVTEELLWHLNNIHKSIQLLRNFFDNLTMSTRAFSYWGTSLMSEQRSQEYSVAEELFWYLNNVHQSIQFTMDNEIDCTSTSLTDLMALWAIKYAINTPTLTSVQIPVPTTTHPERAPNFPHWFPEPEPCCSDRNFSRLASHRGKF
jgi:hypothetical protein